jgi:hypothetical protein
MQAKPVKQHKWLQQLVGNWVYETEMSMKPGDPPKKFKGKESVSSMGGLWVMAAGSGEMPGGGKATMLMTIGYDPAKKKFVGSWVGSMMHNMWVYEGVLKGKVLTLSTVGPSWTKDGKVQKGKTANYRDVITMVGKNKRLLSSFVQGAGGKWTPMMTAHYTRTK